MSTPRADLMPNTTPVPNEILDFWLAYLGPTASSIVLFVARQTYGWCKERDALSIRQFSEGLVREDGTRKCHGTGLSARTLQCEIYALVSVGALIRERQKDRHGRDLSSVYRLNLAFHPDDATTDHLARFRDEYRKKHGTPAEDGGEKPGHSSETLTRETASMSNSGGVQTLHPSSKMGDVEKQAGLPAGVQILLPQYPIESVDEYCYVSTDEKFARSVDAPAIIPPVAAIDDLAQGVDSRESTPSVVSLLESAAAQTYIYNPTPADGALVHERAFGSIYRSEQQQKNEAKLDCSVEAQGPNCSLTVHARESEQEPESNVAERAMELDSTARARASTDAGRESSEAVGDGGSGVGADGGTALGSGRGGDCGALAELGVSEEGGEALDASESAPGNAAGQSVRGDVNAERGLGATDGLVPADAGSGVPAVVFAVGAVEVSAEEEWEAAAALLRSFGNGALSPEDAREYTKGVTIERVVAVIERAAERPEGWQIAFALKALKNGWSLSPKARDSPPSYEHKREPPSEIENGVAGGEIVVSPVDFTQPKPLRDEQEKRENEALKAQLWGEMTPADRAWLTARKVERRAFGKPVAGPVEGLIPVKLVVQAIVEEHEPRDRLRWAA